MNCRYPDCVNDANDVFCAEHLELVPRGVQRKFNDEMVREMFINRAIRIISEKTAP